MISHRRMFFHRLEPSRARQSLNHGTSTSQEANVKVSRTLDAPISDHSRRKKTVLQRNVFASCDRRILTRGPSRVKLSGLHGSSTTSQANATSSHTAVVTPLHLKVRGSVLKIALEDLIKR